MTDDEFDARFSALGGIEPSPRVVDKTIRAWQAERRRSGSRTRILAAVGMAAMAALSLLVISDPAERGDPALMVERGSGDMLPSVVIKAAVRYGSGSVERFAVNQRYAAGDTLMFRVQCSAPATVTLRREGVVLWSGQVPAGESDLPVSYAFEPGEGPARFTVEGGAEPQTVYVPAVKP